MSLAQVMQGVMQETQSLLQPAVVLREKLLGAKGRRSSFR
jgi:hypothetical protein